jgi:hypothetical protein
MAYKVGSTTVIDDSGNVPWARITGVPASSGLIVGVYTKGADVYTNAGSGSILQSTAQQGLEFDSTSAYHEFYLRTYTNCNCNCNCYC